MWLFRADKSGKKVLKRLEQVEALLGLPKMPETLKGCHYLTSNTKKIYKQGRYSSNEEEMNFVYYHGSQELLNRVLLLIEYIIRFLEFRGHSKFDTDYDGIYCEIYGIKVHFSFHEKNRRDFSNKKNSWDSGDLIPTGKLVLKVFEHSFNRKEFEDTEFSKFEDKILYILCWMEIYAEALVEEDRWRAYQRKIREYKEERTRKQKAKEELEIQKFQMLIEYSNQLEEANKIKNYLIQRKKMMLQNKKYTLSEEKYFQWGMQKVKELNPLLKHWDDIKLEK